MSNIGIKSHDSSLLSYSEISLKLDQGSSVVGPAGVLPTAATQGCNHLRPSYFLINELGADLKGLKACRLMGRKEVVAKGGMGG